MSILDNMSRLYEREPHPYGEGLKPVEIGLLADIRGCNILDIGSGDGRLTTVMAEQGNNVFAVDGVASALETLVQTATEKGLAERIDTALVDLNVTGALEEAVGRRQFDVVTLANVLHFLERDAAREVLGVVGRRITDNAEIIIRGPLPRPPLITTGAESKGAFTKNELTDALTDGGMILTSYNEFDWHPRVLPEGETQTAFFAVAQRAHHLRMPSDIEGEAF